jgi:antitoxin component of MazEF toxin-antitoxin module
VGDSAFFKQHPSGTDFPYWLACILAGDLPKVVAEGADLTFDDVVNTFNEKGLVIEPKAKKCADALRNCNESWPRASLSRW